jgi:hypothetical protein
VQHQVGGMLLIAASLPQQINVARYRAARVVSCNLLGLRKFSAPYSHDDSVPSLAAQTTCRIVSITVCG